MSDFSLGGLLNTEGDLVREDGEAYGEAKSMTTGEADFVCMGKFAEGQLSLLTTGVVSEFSWIFRNCCTNECSTPSLKKKGIRKSRTACAIGQGFREIGNKKTKKTLTMKSTMMCARICYAWNSRWVGIRLCS